MFQPARRALCALVLTLATALASLSLPAAASAQLPYSASMFSQSRYAAIVVDSNTGEVLYSRNADAARYPASITKLMTLYLVFEQLQSGRLSLDDQVVVSAHAASMSPTKLGVAAGESISVDTAIRAVALKSANDIAAALAERVGGSESRFAALMTLRAQELGMTNTRFANASGLPDRRQVSSARDIAILSRALMRDFPQYYGYFGQKSFVFRGRTLKNHNRLLGSVPGVDGLKTGYIGASGFNLAASANRNGRRLIAVVLGGSSTATRDVHMEDLIETGYTVLARRDRGEVIQVAQNLFEAAPTGAIVRPPSAQGDEDQRGLQIVVDRDLPSTVSPYSGTAYRNVPRTQPRMTQIPAPRGMQIEREPARPTVKKATAAKAEKPAKLIKAADIKLCEEAAPAKGKKAAKDSKAAKAEKTSPKKGAKGKTTKAKASKGCEADTLKVADKDTGKKKKGKDAKDTKVEKAAARKEDGAWIVQVGAFKDRAAAKTHLAKVSRKVDGLSDAKGSVHGAVNGLFKARFSGLSKEDARAACASAKAKGISCLALNAG
jgi:D-alanyl-D-alanine carboxypeptidase (penicillin-binding protein 5/6)